MSSVSRGDTVVHLCTGSDRASMHLGPRAGVFHPTQLGSGPATASLLLKMTFAVLYYKP